MNKQKMIETTPKFLIHLANTPRCGCCGHVLGEDTDGNQKLRTKITAESVYRPIYWCRTEGCPQHTKRVEIGPVVLEEFILPARV
jgi:hypothetical protein